jgi:Flp pilus assembly protein TadD
MRKILWCMSYLILSACSSSYKNNAVSASSKNENERLDFGENNSMNVRKEKSAQSSDRNQSAPQPMMGTSESAASSSSQLAVYIKNQDDEGVLKESSRLLIQNSNDFKALNAMAMVYYKKGQFNLAKNLLFRAQKNNPTFEVYSNLGIVLLGNEERNEALRQFKKALELNPNDSVSASNAGSIYIKAYDYEKANLVLENSYKRGIKDFRVLNNYAISLVGLGKYENAESVYREALKENSSNKEVLFNFSILLIEHLKKNQEGLEVLQKLKFIGIPEQSRNKIQELELIARKGQK